jgi:phosphoglycerol transferase MdoB-like AlkP superfamily enzyme
MTPTNASVARHARAARTRTIRRRVITLALSLFVAVWLLITLVLISGHDPALAAHATSTTATTPSAATTPTTTTTATTTAQTTTNNNNNNAGSVTTRQS